MNDPKTHTEAHHEELDLYGDGSIKSGHAPFPRWLKWVYVIMPLWGLVWFYFFWNGSYGWLDKGYWSELQQSANTTYPFKNHD
jgi:hypothetical protein